MKKVSLILTLLLAATQVFSQSLPYQWTLDEDNHKLTIGDIDHTGFYDENIIRDVYLEFDQFNYLALLENNYEDAIAIPASITVDGITYPEIGARYKGQTSFFMNNSQKKSFNITMDEYDSTQDLMGYESLNFACGFFDPSWVREFIYQKMLRKHIPAAASNYIRLHVNGEEWGIYCNVQQTNGEFLDEWFMDRNGARWRADSPEGTGGPGGGGGGPGGGGPQWGDGTAALNYLGADTTDYQEHYTLKSSSVVNPWDYLVEACYQLDSAPIETIYDDLNTVFDIDRTLWFLAAENIFCDDDGYIFKGKMDYHVFYEEETGRTVPLEYDGNTILEQQNINWGPFYNADDANYPLLNRLLQNEEARQRYLAHYRTLLSEIFEPSIINPMIEEWASFIDAEVQNDPIAIYSYTEHNSDVADLQDLIVQRYGMLNNHEEIAVESPVISDVNMQSSQGVWENPLEFTSVEVSASASSSEGIAGMNVYYSNSVNGAFERMAMTDIGGGNFSATIGAEAAGTFVRFYFEAISANGVGTRSYEPVGAEHDTYYFSVDPIEAESPKISINELMAVNTTAQADEAGEYDDWLELYNFSSDEMDISGWFLSDNPWNLDKFEIPAGTVMAPDSYLIVWADEDGSQGDYHANFKLSGSGEALYLSNSEGLLVDEVEFGIQSDDIAYARIPNGTGDFIYQNPTFNTNNEHVGIEDEELGELQVFPNPASEILYLKVPAELQGTVATIHSLSGQLVQTAAMSFENESIDISKLPNGMYILNIQSGSQTVNQRFVKR